MANEHTDARNTIGLSSRIISRITDRISNKTLGVARRLAKVPSVSEMYYAKLKGALPGESPIVIDIGANEGQFAQQVFDVKPDARIFSVDPIPENVEKCRHLHGARKSYRVVQAAVGEQSGPDVTFHVIPGATQASSILPVSDVAASNFRSLGEKPRDIQVPYRSLDDLLQQEGHAEPIDLLKVDVEGFEVPVLRGASQTMARSKALLVESQIQAMYQGTSLFDEVCVLARAAGFRFETVLSEVRDMFGEILILDLLFVRK